MPDSTIPEATLEIVNRRRIAAPRDAVFAAFTDPASLTTWWGPEGFTNTIHRFELRPGGQWLLTMHSPNGDDFDNESEFVEIVRPERIVFHHLRPMHWYQMTMEWQDLGSETELNWQMLFESNDENRKLKDFITAANEQNFDRLEAFLRSQKPRS